MLYSSLCKPSVQPSAYPSLDGSYALDRRSMHYETDRFRAVLWAHLLVISTVLARVLHRSVFLTFWLNGENGVRASSAEFDLGSYIDKVPIDVLHFGSIKNQGDAEIALLYAFENTSLQHHSTLIFNFARWHLLLRPGCRPSASSLRALAVSRAFSTITRQR